MSWTATLLAVPPIGVFFLADILKWRFAWQGAAPKLAVLDPGILRADASGRLLMLSAALVVFGAVYLILLRFVADLRGEFGTRTRAWLLGWYAGGITLGTIWVIGGWLQAPSESQLGVDFFRDALGPLGRAGGGRGDALLNGFEWLTQAGRLATMLAAGAVVTGGVSALVDPTEQLSDEHLYLFRVRQRARLRTYVNAAAILLVTSVVFQIAWMRWPLVAVDPAVAVALTRHVDALAIFTGVTGSVVIALFAVPASTILSSRLAALPPPVDGPVSGPLLDTGLLPSLGKVLVILAPTLAGSLPAVLDLAGNIAGQ